MQDDRSWMLNTKAIRSAKLCIQIVKDELGIKLALSHPGFLELLEEYVELTGSVPLAHAYARLASLAGLPSHASAANQAQVLALSESASLSILKIG